MLSVVTVVGTRPEAIKMAPVIGALKKAPWCRCTVVASAQHRALLDQVLELFAIGVDIDLDLMRDGQTLASLSSRLFDRLDAVFAKLRPQLVLAQGDTTTVMVAATTAFYRRIPFGHVEAGLRTGDLTNPFPEEFNRIVTGRVSDLHFAPTETARRALLQEGVDPKNVFVTGNTVVDALLEVARRPAKMPVDIPFNRKLLLLTAHRRENFGPPLQRIFDALIRIVTEFPDVEVIFPVHPNPNVRNLAHQVLRGFDRIHLLEPLDYEALVACLKRCEFVLTDSGGIQEEAPALAKPVLVLREQTERPEAVTAGVAKLIGTSEESVYEEVRTLLIDRPSYQKMARAISPYGDGRAAARITNIIAHRFGAREEAPLREFA